MLVEMSRACLYSELASPLRGNKAHAHAEPVGGLAVMCSYLVSK